MSLKHFEILETFETSLMFRNITGSITFLPVIRGNSVCDIENKMYNLLQRRRLFEACEIKCNADIFIEFRGSEM
jgi:hypothetical protein